MRVQPMELSGGQKALAAAREAAQQRLRRGAEVLRDALPSGGVLFSSLWCESGRAPVLVRFVWPGLLRELNPESGELIAETAASRMIPERPEAAEYLVNQANKRPLLSVKFQPPQSLRLKASIDAFGVVRVRNARTYELLAESIPGEPAALRPGFNPLNRADLAPRLS